MDRGIGQIQSDEDVSGAQLTTSESSPRPPISEPMEFAEIAGRRLHIRRVGSELRGTPLVFLHEGLGSVELWRGFVDEVVAGSGQPGIVYSRYGNGWSTPLSEAREPDYMHSEALYTLPRIIESQQDPPILIGHSDGASIALIYAGSGHHVRGLVLIAPHVFVEPMTIAAISSIADEFTTSSITEKMAKYHIEPTTTFRGWADVWLSSEFRRWDIVEYAADVHCPTLLIQGDSDEYGSMKQIETIEESVQSTVQTVVVPGAEHSPHLSHPETVTGAVVDFIKELT